MPVNSYRWFRGFNDYDNWQASGVSGQGARSFYYPPKSQKCADCHMPLVASQRSGGEERQGPVAPLRRARTPRCRSSTSDPVQLKAVQDFLRDGQISVDVFGLVRGAEPRRPPRRRPSRRRRSRDCRARSPSARSRCNFGAAQNVPRASRPKCSRRSTRSTRSVRRGESVRVEVVVRTRKVGHFFPGGTVDAFDVWVELEAVDDNGRVLLHSGDVADGGKGPGRARRALLPQPAARRARQPDQQAQRLGDAIGRLRAPDSARRRRHGPLPAADSRGRRRAHHLQGEGELPQVRLVEHAVGVRRRPRSGADRVRR